VTDDTVPSDDLDAFARALIGSRFSVSPKRLHAPGPSAGQLQAIVEAAATAPDHRELRPWRLLRIGAAQRGALADLFEAALLERDPAAGAAERAEARAKAHRAPELLLAIVRLGPPHDDVVEHERYVSLGAALMAMLLAAHAMGFAGMLTAGRALRSVAFAQGLGLAPDERAVCFVSLGTPSEVRRRPRPSASDLLADWRLAGGG
jgi:nitroreductase